MPSKSEKKYKRILKIIILAMIALISFVVSMGMNIIGMRSVINKEPNTSGMVGLSSRNTTSVTSKSKNETSKNKKEEKKYTEVDTLINAVPLISLNNSNWDKLKSGFSDVVLDEDGNYTSEEGYTLYCNGKKVNYIIFNSNFEGEIIGHLKVGDDFKTVKSKLGNPTFKSDEYIGYKTREVYVFFYKDQIVAYSNKDVTNNGDLETFLNSYFEKTYTEGRTRFLVEIRERYDDFEIEMDEETNTVIMTSLERQMKVKLDSIGTIEVELYDDYNVVNERTSELIEEGIFRTNEKDLVEVFEKERIA